MSMSLTGFACLVAVLLLVACGGDDQLRTAATTETGATPTRTPYLESPRIPTLVPAESPSKSPTLIHIAAPDPTPTATPEPTLSEANILTFTPTAPLEPTPTPTATLAPAPTTMPTATATPEPTPTPTATLAPAPTTMPTATATPEPAPTPTLTPTPTPRPKPSASPDLVRFLWEGAVIRGSWQAVEGAAYYKVYYDDSPGSICRLEQGGNPSSCELLADNVLGTSYTHSGPDRKDNYYWVVACNSSGCSDSDSDSPAHAPNAKAAYGWAADFVGRVFVVDGNVNWKMRVDPNCTADCERSYFPGTGQGDFGTLKATTGLDMGLISVGSGLAAMTRLRDRVDDGRYANGKVIRSYADMETAEQGGDYAVMFYVQSRVDPHWQLNGDITRLREWYSQGLRVLQLAYGTKEAHGPDERLGYGHSEGEDRGLTDLGRAVITEMNSLGMVVDLSHCSRRTTLDAAALSTKPVLATHANAEALTAHSRNKDDEELLAIAGTGGVIGVTTIRRLLDTDRDGAAGMDEMIAHIEYIVELVGINHVGLATDAYMDGWEKSSGHYADADLAALDRWVLLASHLYARGWSEEDLAKLLGGNFLRVFSEVLVAQ